MKSLSLAHTCPIIILKFLVVIRFQSPVYFVFPASHSLASIVRATNVGLKLTDRVFMTQQNKALLCFS